MKTDSDYQQKLKSNQFNVTSHVFKFDPLRDLSGYKKLKCNNSEACEYQKNTGIYVVGIKYKLNLPIFFLFNTLLRILFAYFDLLLVVIMQKSKFSDCNSQSQRSYLKYRRSILGNIYSSSCFILEASLRLIYDISKHECFHLSIGSHETLLGYTQKISEPIWHKQTKQYKKTLNTSRNNIVPTNFKSDWQIIK